MRKILALLVLLCTLLNCSTKNQQQAVINEEIEDPLDIVELLEPQPISKLNSTKPAKEKDEKTRRKTISLDSLEGTPCNIRVILYAYENVDNMSIRALDKFLRIFSFECDNNAEFGEFSQEMIFDVFSKYPKEIATLISENDYNIEAITYELGGPLLDPVIEPIIEDFKATGIKNTNVDSVITALERGAAWLREN